MLLPDGRAAPVPIVDDLQEVAPLLGGERGKAPVVEDQQLGARQTLEEPCIAPITASERERIEQPGQAMVEDRAVVAAGLVTERASNPTFADSGRADDEQVLVAVDPVAGGEFLEQRLVEAARGFVVDVLDDSGLAQAWRP